MKNADKLLFVVALLACVGGVAAYTLLTSSANEKSAVAKVSPRGADVAAWADNAASDVENPKWKSPELDTAEGWNYDLFNSPEISWNTKQKKYFAKELPPPPEEVFGLQLKSLSNPKFRLVINSYSAGTRPVPEETAPGRYAAVLTIADVSGKRAVSKIVNFGGANVSPITLSDNTDASGDRAVVLTPEAPITIPGTSAKLKSFRITRGRDSSGAFVEDLNATIIDESGRAPREFVIGTSPVGDKNRVEAVFTDGFSEWRYSETVVPGQKTPVREIARRASPDQPFEFVESGREIRIGSDVFRIKGLDISSQEVRIEKQSDEVDKKTKAPKTTERVLTPER